jgi:DNA-binding beta-propeller fold protein YncE
MRYLGAVVGVFLLALPAGAPELVKPPPAPTATRLFVGTRGADYIEVFDLASRSFLDRIPVGRRPHGLALGQPFLAMGRWYQFLYVTVEETGELVIVDALENAVFARTRVGRTPHQLTVTRDGLTTYIPLRDDAAVAVAQLNTEVMAIETVKTTGRTTTGKSASFVLEPRPRLVKRLETGEWPYNAYTGATTGRIYVTHMRGKKITVLDPTTQETLYEVELPGEVRPLALTRDETRAYAALSGRNGFVVVDLAERKVVRQVELPALPANRLRLQDDTIVHGMAISPDDRELWVANAAGGAVYVYSVPELQLKMKIPMGGGPWWFAWQPPPPARAVEPRRASASAPPPEAPAPPAYPVGWRLWVSRTAADSVSAIDPATGKVVGTFQTGPVPRSILVLSPRQP